MIRACLLTLLASACLLAQNAALMPMPRQQFFDANGLPLAGGLIYTYAAGTNTPQSSYTDSTATTPNTNPVVLDAGGFGSIWLATSMYKIVATNANGVQQWSVDNVGGLAVISNLNNISGTITASRFFGPLTGNVTGNVTGNLTGNVQGNVTGSLTGNVTGNVTGNLTGNVQATTVQATTITGALSGNAATATALAALPTSCPAGQSASGVDINGNALGCTAAPVMQLQSVEGSACATSNASGATCTAPLTWPSAYPDTAYKVSCSLVGPITGFPSLLGVTKTLTGLTVTITNGTANMAVVSTAAAIDCIAHGK